MFYVLKKSFIPFLQLIWILPSGLTWSPSSFQETLNVGVPLFRDDRLGAVASENRECSTIGIDLLRDGGNAADAVCSDSLLPYKT